MWHFAGENKPGFAKGTRSVTRWYTTSYVTKFFLTVKLLEMSGLTGYQRQDSGGEYEGGFTDKFLRMDGGCRS